MKKIAFLFCTLFFSLNSEAQKIALLDNKFKKPIIYTDSITVNQIYQGSIAVAKIELDSLYANFEYLNEILSVRQRAKMESFDLLTINTKLSVERIPMAYGDRYKINFTSKYNGIVSLLNISNAKTSNKDLSNQIKSILFYIQNNISMFTKPNEIHPMLYNVIVISGH